MCHCNTCHNPLPGCIPIRVFSTTPWGRIWMHTSHHLRWVVSTDKVCLHPLFLVPRCLDVDEGCPSGIPGAMYPQPGLGDYTAPQYSAMHPSTGFSQFS